MYKNSSGELKEVATMETTYLTNALFKCYRDTWNCTTIEQYNDNQKNITVLREELDKRFNQFNIEKIQVTDLGGNQ